MLGFVVLIVSSGLFTKFYRNSAFPRSVKKGVKNFHRWFAYIIVVIFKVNVLWSWYYSPPMAAFACIMAWEVLCLLIWVYLKFFIKKVEGTVVDMRTKLGSVDKIVNAKTTSSIK